VDINIPKDIKNIEAQVIENISISSQQIELIDFISQYYIVPIHHAASLFFPKNIKEKLLKNTLHKLTAQEYQYSTPKINLSAQQQKIFDTIVVSANKKTLLY
jgi:primosomal protein N'